MVLDFFYSYFLISSGTQTFGPCLEEGKWKQVKLNYSLKTNFVHLVAVWFSFAPRNWGHHGVSDHDSGRVKLHSNDWETQRSVCVLSDVAAAKGTNSHRDCGRDMKCLNALEILIEKNMF